MVDEAENENRKVCGMFALFKRLFMTVWLESSLWISTPTQNYTPTHRVGDWPSYDTRVIAIVQQRTTTMLRQHKRVWCTIPVWKHFYLLPNCQYQQRRRM